MDRFEEQGYQNRMDSFEDGILSERIDREVTRLHSLMQHSQLVLPGHFSVPAVTHIRSQCKFLYFLLSIIVTHSMLLLVCTDWTFVKKYVKNFDNFTSKNSH